MAASRNLVGQQIIAEASAMGIRVIALQLDDKLCRTLEEVAAHLRLGAIENALRIAAAD